MNWILLCNRLIMLPDGFNDWFVPSRESDDHHIYLVKIKQ